MWSIPLAREATERYFQETSFHHTMTLSVGFKLANFKFKSSGLVYFCYTLLIQVKGMFILTSVAGLISEIYADKRKRPHQPQGELAVSLGKNLDCHSVLFSIAVTWCLVQKNMRHCRCNHLGEDL